MWVTQKSRRVYLCDPRSESWCKTNSSMKTWMRLKKNAWLSFERICKGFLGNHKAANYQDIVQDLLNSYRVMGCNTSLKIHFLESHLDFPQKISAKSVTKTVKDFTIKTFWLWKSGTKASGPQVCWQTIAGNWIGIYLTPNTGESHTPLQFRGKFLPVSWAH